MWLIIPTTAIASPTPETVEVVKTTAKVLSEAGVAVEEDRPPGIEQSFDLFTGLLAADGGAGLRMLLQMAGTTELHPLMQGVLDTVSPKAVSAAEFMGLWFRWDMLRGAMLSFMEKYDGIISPVCAYPAMPHGLQPQTGRLSVTCIRIR